MITLGLERRSRCRQCRLCFSSVGLSITTAGTRNTEPAPVLIDSTGLKVYGSGEWQTEKQAVLQRFWGQYFYT